jgi:hypothetical protein
VARNARSPRSSRSNARSIVPEEAGPEHGLVDDLAHRISQPLAAIIGYARGCQLRARNQTLGPEDLERALEDIAQEALRAGALLRTLRETTTERK